MDEFLRKHEAVMDKYDPEKKVALVVDEWGAWHAALPGTNPSFLVQQNSMRDAILASLNLNIFARHASRVRMSNIAQMINVLQAMILTDKEKMVVTPTYYVYKMYVPFQDATFVPMTFDPGTYTQGSVSLPRVDALAARDASGKLWVEITNLLIPTLNDAPAETRALCEWILENLGPDVPLHFTAFHPDFKLRDKPRTPDETLHAARAIALEVGLRYVYEGNIRSGNANTSCPSCHSLLIRRNWHTVQENRLVLSKPLRDKPIAPKTMDSAGTGPVRPHTVQAPVGSIGGLTPLVVNVSAPPFVGAPVTRRSDPRPTSSVSSGLFVDPKTQPTDAHCPQCAAAIPGRWTLTPQPRST